MPALGLGTWKSTKGEVYEVIRKAISIGYRHFDCAAIYENEAEIGEALSDAIKAGDVLRSELWITSKLWNNAHRKDDVLPAFEKTLGDLRLDYLDLYLMHWPLVQKKEVGFPTKGSDFHTLSEVPLKETWAEMEKLQTSGKVNHIGVSNFNIRNLEVLMAEATVKPEMNQIEMHPFLPQHKLVNYCKTHGLHLTAYSPLGSGDRPAQRKKADEPNMFTQPEIVRIAEDHGITPAQASLAWQVNRGGVSVIPKSTNPERLRLNLEAADVDFSKQEMNILDNLPEKYRFIDGSIWTFEGSPYTMQDLWEYE